MSDPNNPQQGPYRGQQPPPPPYGQQPPPYQPPPPYGQQPPPYDPYEQRYEQQPSGQPDYPPPPPQDYPAAPAQPGPPPKKGSKRTFVIIGVVVVLLVAGFFVFRALNKNSASKAGAGDCIKVNSASEKSADVEKIDCNDQIAVFKVAKKLGNDTDQCPTDAYEKYMQSGGGSGDFALCLMLNAKEGECFANLSDPAKFARADCANADIKVTKVVADKADEAACEAPSAPLVYPEPATTFCLAKP